MMGFHWLGEEYTPYATPRDFTSLIILHAMHNQAGHHALAQRDGEDTAKRDLRGQEVHIVLCAAAPVLRALNVEPQHAEGVRGAIRGVVGDVERLEIGNRLLHCKGGTKHARRRRNTITTACGSRWKQRPTRGQRAECEMYLGQRGRRTSSTGTGTHRHATCRHPAQRSRTRHDRGNPCAAMARDSAPRRCTACGGSWGLQTTKTQGTNRVRHARVTGIACAAYQEHRWTGERDARPVANSTKQQNRIDRAATVGSFRGKAAPHTCQQRMMAKE